MNLETYKILYKVATDVKFAKYFGAYTEEEKEALRFLEAIGYVQFTPTVYIPYASERGYVFFKALAGLVGYTEEIDKLYNPKDV